MATALALKEQESAAQLQSAQAAASRQERAGQVVPFPKRETVGAASAAQREVGLSAGERLGAEQARARADAEVIDLDPYLEANAGDSLSDEDFEAYVEQMKAVTEQLRAATTLAGLREIWRRKLALESELTESTLSKEQRKLIDEARDQIWRGIRSSLPLADDSLGGWSCGLFSFAATAIYYFQFVKGIRYMYDEEPLTMIAILEPPPLELKAKDVAALAKRILFWLIDILGFVWSNGQTALVLGLLFFSAILISSLFYCYNNPLEAAMIPEVRDICTGLGFGVDEAVQAVTQ